MTGEDVALSKRVAWILRHAPAEAARVLFDAIVEHRDAWRSSGAA